MEFRAKYNDIVVKVVLNNTDLKYTISISVFGKEVIKSNIGEHGMRCITTIIRKGLNNENASADYVSYFIEGYANLINMQIVRINPREYNIRVYTEDTKDAVLSMVFSLEEIMNFVKAIEYERIV